MASLLTKMFLKSEVLPDGRLRCIVPPSRPGIWQRPEEIIFLALVNQPSTHFRLQSFNPLTTNPFPSYRNQSLDLQSKSADWFLYDGNISSYRVK